MTDGSAHGTGQAPASPAASTKNGGVGLSLISHGLAMVLAVCLIAVGVADLSIARRVLADYTDAIKIGTTPPRRPIRVAVINLARGGADCNALIAQDKRTPPDCIAWAVDQASARQAAAVVVDHILPAGPAPLSDADRRLFAAIARSRVPVVMLHQPQSLGDGINAPLRTITNIFDGLSAPSLHWAVAQFHGDAEGGDRYAEAYRSADGAIVPGVVMTLRQVLGTAVQPRRVLDGSGAALRRLTIPIPTEPKAAPLAMAGSAGIVEVGPGELAGASLGGRVWLIGNAYVAGTTTVQDDLHIRRDGAEDAGILLMARAIHAADQADAPVVRVGAWWLMITAVAAITIGCNAALQCLLKRFVEGKAITLPFRPLIEAIVGILIIALFGFFWHAVLTASWSWQLVDWQVTDLVSEALIVAAIVIVIAPIIDWGICIVRGRLSRTAMTGAEA